VGEVAVMEVVHQALEEALEALPVAVGEAVTIMVGLKALEVAVDLFMMTDLLVILVDLLCLGVLDIHLVAVGLGESLVLPAEGMGVVGSPPSLVPVGDL